MAIGPVYRPFLEVVREAGVDVDAELARIGFSDAEIDDGQTRLTPEQGRALVTRLRRLCPDLELGLLAAERCNLEQLDLVGYLARHAQTALEALELLARYDRLLGDTAEFRLARTRGEVRMTLGLAGGYQMLPEGADFAVAVLFKCLRQLTQGRALPLEVGLPRARPARVEPYRRCFGNLPRFGAERATLRYSEAVLTTPITGRDARLSRILEQQARQATAQLPGGSVQWLSRVRAQLAAAVRERGPADIAGLARRSGVSERTLRRRLEEAGTSFRELADDVRRDLALQQIDQGQTRVALIAEAAGYTDGTAFTRAFRRWTGVAPQQYLERRP